MLWNDKLIHCLSYFALSMTFDFSWKSSEKLVIKSILVFLYSSLIEYGQSFVPGREMSIEDVFANLAGIILFIVCVPLFKRAGTYNFLRLV